MILQSSLRTEGGVQGYLPTTLFYKRRVKRQLAEIKRIERERLLVKKRIAEEKAEEEYRQRRAQELAKLKQEDPKAYDEYMQREHRRQLSNIFNGYYH